MHAKNTGTFPKNQRTESANKHANDTEIFLEGFNFYGCTKNYFRLEILFFLGHHKRAFLGARQVIYVGPLFYNVRNFFG